MKSLLRMASKPFSESIKHLKTTAVSIPTGLQVTYPNIQNKTHDVENALETFISSLAACETATLRGIAGMKKIQLGQIKWTKIESSYNLGNWKTGGGPTNKINDINLSVEVEANLSEEAFQQVK
jgi:uncharacterized OsmC-like protein